MKPTTTALRDDAIARAEFEKDRIIEVWVQVGFYEEPIMMAVRNDMLRIYERQHQDVRELPVSTELQNAFLEWDAVYQATLDHNYPPDSCFASKQIEHEHAMQGSVLAQRLQAELGQGYTVTYRSLIPL